jgi:prevent-host-death family protein
MAVSEFKAHALQVLGQVAKNNEPVLVTKRGKPLAEVVPYRGSEQPPVPGRLSETLVFEKDILSPLGESIWNASR